MNTNSKSEVRRQNGGRRGFAFTEILFAVMVLGIGFIMIAAMFPVTIRQTQSTLEESVASSAGKAAIAYLQSAPGLAQLRGTELKANAPLQTAKVGTFFSNNHAVLLSQFSGGMVLPHNPRIGWTALYRRVTDSPYAQVYVIVLQSRNRAGFDFRDLVGSPPNFAPKAVKIDLTYDNAKGAYVCKLNSDAAVEGAFVIISDDKVNGPNEGRHNGHVVQLGSFDANLAAWNLTPGYELPETTTGNFSGADAWIVGRGNLFDSAANAYSNTLGGTAMDIGIYVGFIKLN